MTPARRITFWSQFIVMILLTGLFRLQHPSVPTPTYDEYTVKNIYLDTSFTEDEQQIFLEAAEEWKQSTGGRVDYIIYRMPEKHLDPEASIIITKVSQYSPEVLELDERDKDMTLGYYNLVGRFHYIALVTERIKPFDYKAVVLHEFGHSLGLKHDEGKTLMNHHIDDGARFITATDLYHFCELHGCQAWTLHDQEEPSHP